MSATSRTAVGISLAISLLAACASTPPQPPVVEEEEYWGLPNLVIQAFIPPIILAGEGDTIYLSDLTANVGDNISDAAKIRYYISDASPVDVTTALIIGERQVRELKPKQHDESMEKPFVIPEGAGQPPLFLAACVDVDNVVYELVEEDNCTTSPAGADQLIFDSGGIMPR
jgi:hypothetical protein